MIWRKLYLFWTASIGRQLMLGIALVHAILMTVFIYDLVSRQSDFLVRESLGQAVALSKTLATNGSSWLLSDDIIGLEEVINSQNAYPGLKYAMFTDLNGKVLGFSDRSKTGQYLTDDISLKLVNADQQTQTLIDDPTLIDIAHPVSVGDRHIGWARVGISRTGITKSLQDVIHNGLLYTALAILSGLVFAYFMGHGLTVDIRRLLGNVKRIEKGDRNVECRLDRRDELGVLAHGIESTLEELAEREQELKLAHQQVQDNAQRLDYALEGANAGIWDWQVNTSSIYFSPRFKQLLGYKPDELENDIAEWSDRLHPLDAGKTWQAVDDVLHDKAGFYEDEHRILHKDGTYHWMLVRGQAFFDDNREAYRMVGTCEDISHKKELENKLYEERERALVTLQSIGDGVITTLANGHVDYLNPVAEKITGWTTTAAHGKTLEQIFPIIDELSRKPVSNPVAQCLRDGRIVEAGEYALLSKTDGTEISIESSAAPIKDKSGRITGAVLIFHDATHSRQMQRQMQHQALHDDLTGLWNRRAFDQRLTELADEALSGDGKHVLVYIDLDQFKVINDTVGHLAGDELLRQISLILEDHTRDSDMLARLGGDEFGLLLVGCDRSHAEAVAENLRNHLAGYQFGWDDKSFAVGASFGIVVLDQNLSDPNALSLADLACYTAKEKGRNRLHVYTPEDNELAQKRSEMQWLTRIRNAIDDDRIVLYCQKIKSIKAGQGKVDYREILVRIRDLDKSMIPPGQFIPAAERYGLMNQIDKLVFSKSFEWMNSSANADVFLSINLSGNSLSDPDLLTFIKDKMANNPAIAKRICFEITETAAISNLRVALDFIHQLKACQVSFALDDFGSGLSSFGYLKTLPVDFLKIDGEFVRDLLDDPIDAAMVEAIAKVGREMGIATIAEFVESEALVEELTRLGVDYVQGYIIDKPVPLPGFETPVMTIAVNS